ncbi:hypothetical protein I551_8572 [Mycobacterium ulcerans str. Harvey]|uniref:Uncharacterized protein n=1 Tax=Mycobacterium ulcerans str. Harvey TaxID=1299332 RepID=A0ABN0RAU1_MYCUL|nr:hypothetical protein I551_8572 [Mycobacterium ulcerans str. Harvey]
MPVLTDTQFMDRGCCVLGGTSADEISPTTPARSKNSSRSYP